MRSRFPRTRGDRPLGTFDSNEGKAERIGVNRDSHHPEMTAAHEIGHFLDFSGLPGERDGWDYEQSVLAARADEAAA